MGSGKYLENVYASQVFGTVGVGRKVVTTAGTAVVLAAATDCRTVVITALSTNTNVVVIGDANVIGAAATRKGIGLAAGQSVSIGIDNLSKLYLDSITNGEGVSYAYFL